MAGKVETANKIIPFEKFYCYYTFVAIFNIYYT